MNTLELSQPPHQAQNQAQNQAQPKAQRLDGQRVVIIGGTSGIGLSAAIQARALGAHVVIVGRDAQTAQRLAHQHGFEGWRAGDVRSAADIERALTDIPHVDHLVLLAGTFVAGKIREADIGHLQGAFDERIWAAVHAIRALGDRLDKHGSVTLISGVLADRPNAYGTAVLAAASAAMEAFARGLALELAPLRVNTLSPGPIDTPLLARTLGAGRNAYVDALTQQLPLHRLGTAEEAAAGVVFLMTNGFMNGATLHLDGGAALV
ncbi:NAD(P)-dependent dehydrogenase (short-subunit alcohol dehydrogenase family) [Cupriavidus plantarum]|uniref:NAD(P)-dependent dehydrogenase (Short-subunit alcohol dehydrogenase family) n=2 Tax=Cupriavidus plantarum TaxID=942865 RepID=A0A316EPV9_9BURK|nr:NAD(P)-dependent dehydrogenase (short-subunit alcohol dehydrogenase family) [Cupriavidus plantarum]